MRKKSINSISSLVLLLLGFSIAATIFVSYWSIFATIILLIILVVIYPWEKEPAIEIKKDTYPSKCQTLILSKDANEAEKTVMHALHRKVAEYESIVQDRFARFIYHESDELQELEDKLQKLQD